MRLKNEQVRKNFLEIFKNDLKEKDKPFNRLLFVDYVDMLEKDKIISSYQAQCIAYPKGKLFN